MARPVRADEGPERRVETGLAEAQRVGVAVRGRNALAPAQERPDRGGDRGGLRCVEEQAGRVRARRRRRSRARRRGRARSPACPCACASTRTIPKSSSARVDEGRGPCHQRLQLRVGHEAAELDVAAGEPAQPRQFRPAADHDQALIGQAGERLDHGADVLIRDQPRRGQEVAALPDRRRATAARATGGWITSASRPYALRIRRATKCELAAKASTPCAVAAVPEPHPVQQQPGQRALDARGSARSRPDSGAAGPRHSAWASGRRQRWSWSGPVSTPLATAYELEITRS